MPTTVSRILTPTFLFATLQTPSFAFDKRACVIDLIAAGNDDMTLAEVKRRCDILESEASSKSESTESLIEKRLIRESISESNRSVITPHLRNYILPFTFAGNPKDDNVSVVIPGDEEELDNSEAVFQLSIKASVGEQIFTQKDTAYVAVTVHSFWQVYNQDLSAPFRETVYTPEVFWMTPWNWNMNDDSPSFFALGIRHQSNGRSQPYSRSWNRVVAAFIWEYKNIVFNLQPWWRIPEKQKTDPLQASGDDNPDIDDYLGYFEWNTSVRWNNTEASVTIRDNLRTENNKGSIEIGYSFPLWKRLRGYVHYFNGYGESLIDYDNHIERVGVGILLTDML